MRRRLGVVAMPLIAALGAVLLGHVLLESPRTLLGAVDLPSGQATVAIDARTGRAFVATAQDGAVRVIDLDRGVLLRTVHLQPAQQGYGYARTLLAVDDRRGWAVAVTPVGAVFVLDGRSGAVVRAFAAAQSSSITGLAIDAATGQILLGDAQVGVVTVIDPSTGAVQRRMAVGGGVYRLSLSTWGNRALVQRSGMGSNSLLLLDTRSGRVLASVRLSGGRGLFGGGYFGSPSVAIDDQAGRAYVADTGAGLIRALDLRRARVSLTIATGIHPRAIAIDPRTGHLFVLDAGADQVRMFDGATGASLRSVAAGTGASALAADAHGETLLAASWGIRRARGFQTSSVPLPARGQLRVLDARTGATLRTVAVGAAPVAIAVDAASGHAVVITTGGTAVTDPLGWLPSTLRERLPWLSPPAQAAASIPPRAEVLAIAP